MEMISIGMMVMLSGIAIIEISIMEGIVKEVRDLRGYGARVAFKKFNGKDVRACPCHARTLTDVAFIIFMASISMPPIAFIFVVVTNWIIPWCVAFFIGSLVVLGIAFAICLVSCRISAPTTCPKKNINSCWLE